MPHRHTSADPDEPDVIAMEWSVTPPESGPAYEVVDVGVLHCLDNAGSGERGGLVMLRNGCKIDEGRCGG